jgi:hypothetical protein
MESAVYGGVLLRLQRRLLLATVSAAQYRSPDEANIQIRGSEHTISCQRSYPLLTTLSKSYS